MVFNMMVLVVGSLLGMNLVVVDLLDLGLRWQLVGGLVMFAISSSGPSLIFWFGFGFQILFDLLDCLIKNFNFFSTIYSIFDTISFSFFQIFVFLSLLSFVRIKNQSFSAWLKRVYHYLERDCFEVIYI